MAIASYTWSRDEGNYSGLSSSDETGRDNPNNSRDYDYPVMSFDGQGQILDGVLDTDRTHQVKVQALYLPSGARRSARTSSRRAVCR
jgi:hypothetical protein